MSLYLKHQRKGCASASRETKYLYIAEHDEWGMPSLDIPYLVHSAAFAHTLNLYMRE